MGETKNGIVDGWFGVVKSTCCCKILLYSIGVDNNEILMMVGVSCRAKSILINIGILCVAQLAVAGGYGMCVGDVVDHWR